MIVDNIILGSSIFLRVMSIDISIILPLILGRNPTILTCEIGFFSLLSIIYFGRLLFREHIIIDFTICVFPNFSSSFNCFFSNIAFSSIPEKSRQFTDHFLGGFPSRGDYNSSQIRSNLTNTSKQWRCNSCECWQSKCSCSTQYR